MKEADISRTMYDAITVYDMSRIGTSTRQEALVVPIVGRGGDMRRNANGDSSSPLSHESILKLMVVMVSQIYEYTKTTELNTSERSVSGGAGMCQ